jgi:hypothetical protein
VSPENKTPHFLSSVLSFQILMSLEKETECKRAKLIFLKKDHVAGIFKF